MPLESVPTNRERFLAAVRTSRAAARIVFAFRNRVLEPAGRTLDVDHVEPDGSSDYHHGAGNGWPMSL